MTPNFPKIIYGTAWKRERTDQCVKQAIEHGFFAIDTANQPKHYDEARVGQALQLKFQEGFKREQFFLQTKFTQEGGQDHRIPYNPRLPIAEQVKQSFESSLQHLGVTYLDSYILHGPYHHPGLGAEDEAVWRAIEDLHEEGKAKHIGISNINPQQLTELLDFCRFKPQFVQNRCFASTGWDWQMRKLCRDNQIVYQGFSLLTANPALLHDGEVEGIAQKYQLLPTQLIFAFARTVGMIPLTGTTSGQHLAEDLAAVDVEISDADCRFLEEIAL